MAGLIRSFDWSRTSLGDIATWSERVQAVVDLTLDSPLVSSLVLGNDRLLIYNDAAARLYGERHPSSLGQPLADTFPDSYPAVAALYDQVFGGETVAVKAQPLAVGTSGGNEVFDAYLTPIRATDGTVVGAHMIGFEIGAKERAETALREREAMLRQFGAASSDTIWIRDAKTLRYEYVSPAAEVLYGVGRDAFGDGTDIEGWTSLIYPDDRGRALASIERLRSGESLQQEYRILRLDGEVRWIQCTDFPIPDETGAIRRIGGIVQDVTGTRAMIEREKVLVAELHHRTRNLIGVVGSIARQTMAQTGPTLAFQIAFTERLTALSRVQSLLERAGNERVLIGDIVRLELDALGGDAFGERLRLEGPTLAVRKSAVQTLALALHELATNARKYGALSNSRGKLVVRWSAYEQSDQPRLLLEWSESGVDMPAAESGPVTRGSGYGRELIERALPYQFGAKTTYDLGSDGVRCTIDVPLKERMRKTS